MVAELEGFYTDEQNSGDVDAQLISCTARRCEIVVMYTYFHDMSGGRNKIGLLNGS